MRTLFVLVSALLLNTVSSTDICDLNNRQDCGYVGINQQQCESKGCCWNPAPSVAWCFYKSGPPSYYTITQSNPTTNGYQATLQLNTPGGTYGNNIQTLSATLTFETADRVRLRITDPSKTRWEIPDRILPFPKPQPTSTFHYTVSRSLPNLPAWLAITRTIDGVVVFNATDLQFADQFLQLSTMLPDSTTSDGPNLYGLGEHVDPLRLSLDNHVYTLWNVDIPTPVDQNVYGAHPFFMQLLHSSGNAHGIWLRNSNGMDIITSKTKVTYRTIGGILDVYVMLGPSPAAVITQYHDIIGHPHMPPYWSLGWHQCKYGYKNLDEIKGVVDAYAKAQIPLDTMWNDIDYMNEYEDFSFDPINYPQDQMRTFVNKLHDAGQHYVLIIDPGIHNRQGYASYDDGLSRGIFINKSDGVTPFIGKVWPGTTAFPDFLNPDTESYWYDQIKAFLGLVDIDGLWIDMNELSNFDNGASENPRADVNNPPYHINNFRNHAPLNSKTLAMDALHYGGVPEYDAHNLFGFTEAIATNKALEKIRGKRSFVLTRSTFSGSGAHAAHWLGDNQATWQAMAYSIPGILNMNLLGIPFVGVDICGFQDTTTEELCSRWTALGSFYPFARNHHDTSGHQEPYLWESVTRVAKKTLGARYSLLPYYYTLFFSAHQNGGTVARPLWMEYPTDSNTYAIDAQFLIGSGLLISPVLQQGANSVTAYFPSASIWYNYWNGQNQPSGIQTLATGMEEIQVHVRGGTILPCQEPALTTTATRKNPFYLIVALDNDQKADGSVFIDDGESLDIGASSTYVLFNAIPNAFTATAQSTQQTDPLPPLDTIHFWGLQTSVSNVTVNAQSWNKFAFNSSTDILTISGLNLDLKKSFHVEWA